MKKPELLSPAGDMERLDMALRYDNAFLDLQRFAVGGKGTSRRPLNVAGLADNAFYPEFSCVGDGKLHLCLLTARAEDGDVFKLPLGANDGNALLGQKLSRLAELLCRRQRGAFSK